MQASSVVMAPSSSMSYWAGEVPQLTMRSSGYAGRKWAGESAVRCPVYCLPRVRVCVRRKNRVNLVYQVYQLRVSFRVRMILRGSHFVDG